ncbi:hypothetical protein MAJHIDBO_00250 [Propionibacterium freudenreichii subsp. shermanii]|nr:hypothetical protein MAJHIDBO_00250 [Propionibacterium freudenreichii subsp. shermanii]SPS08039.1 hypothetical protein MAJHIDBO_00250 [Propionibacterium freudenreichii subsp. shermanii]
MPWRPVRVYPSSQPWQLCSESTSMTRPVFDSLTSSMSVGSMKVRSLTSKTAPSRLEFVSSGQKSRKFVGFLV